jgi:hypothetical protein
MELERLGKIGVPGLSILRELVQTKLAFSTQSGRGRQNTLNALFGMAVFTSYTAFSIFDTLKWGAFFTAVGFKIPNRYIIADTILD